MCCQDALAPTCSLSTASVPCLHVVGQSGAVLCESALAYMGSVSTLAYMYSIGAVRLLLLLLLLLMSLHLQCCCEKAFACNQLVVLR